MSQGQAAKAQRLLPPERPYPVPPATPRRLLIGTHAVLLRGYPDGVRAFEQAGSGAGQRLRPAPGISLGAVWMPQSTVEAVLCSLADALGCLVSCGVRVTSVLLIGGAARSAAVRAIAPAVFGVPVTVPPPAEYVALGAARQAAWALSGLASPPQWPQPGGLVYEGVADDTVLARYASLRDATATWDTDLSMAPLSPARHG